jgi:hypothetical protein
MPVASRAEPTSVPSSFLPKQTDCFPDPESQQSLAAGRDPIIETLSSGIGRETDVQIRMPVAPLSLNFSPKPRIAPPPFVK